MLQTELIKNFRDDVPKYTRGNLQVDNIWKVWQRIPRFLGQEIKYSTLGEGDPAARTSKKPGIVDSGTALSTSVLHVRCTIAFCSEFKRKAF